MKITKKDCESKRIINIEDYLMKKKDIKKEYGRHRYLIMSEKNK